MKILCLYPGMDIRVNDNAWALVYLRERGIHLTVICSRLSHLKTRTECMEADEMEGIPIYRVYKDFSEQSSWPVKQYPQVYRIAKEFDPDLIFCSQQFNMHLANRLRKDFHVPIVLLVEYATDPLELRRSGFWRVWRLLHPAGHVYWRWLCRSTGAIITSYIGDVKYLQQLARYGTPVYYVPWCNHIPDEVAAGQAKTRRRRGIYVGSLSRWKNTDEFLATIPIILERTPVEEFVIVGPGEGVRAVDVLKKRYGERIRYFESLPRAQALQLIQESLFSYTPIKRGGWGFIGDSWGVKTPLVVTHNEYGLRDGTDALTVDRRDHIDLAVNQLCESPELYGRLQKAGFERYQQDHSAQSVGARLWDVFDRTMRAQTGISEH